MNPTSSMKRITNRNMNIPKELLDKITLKSLSIIKQLIRLAKLRIGLKRYCEENGEI
jgi:hypothetical protein